MDVRESVLEVVGSVPGTEELVVETSVLELVESVIGAECVWTVDVPFSVHVLRCH